MTPDDLLRAQFDAAVAAAQPERCLPAHLPTPPKGRTIVVGAGKASASMARALEALAGTARRTSGDPLRPRRDVRAHRNR